MPLGFGIWLAHYSFHLFTGLLTFIPVTQSALADAGLPLLGPPALEPARHPAGFVHPLELGFLALGLLGSLLVAWRIAEREVPGARRPRLPPLGRALPPPLGVRDLASRAADGDARHVMGS